MSGAQTRRRAWIWVGIFVLLVVALAIANRDDATYGAPLDPRNPKPEGGQALAKVLERQGVDVTIARGQEALLDTEVDDGTSIVVSGPEQLGTSTWRRLRDHAGRAPVLVLGAGQSVFDALGVQPTGQTSGRVAGRCDDPLVGDLRIETPDALTVGGEGCFVAAQGVLLRRLPDDVSVLTAAGALDNAHVLDGDNAAIGLRLLGSRDRLVWYVPSAADTRASDAVSVRTLLPPWVDEALLLGSLAVLALLLWRGRRLGALVTEPLPVVVRAAESTLSRGRLYHRSRDRSHAAAALRAGTRRRLAQRLGLAGNPGVADLVAVLREQGPAEDLEVLDQRGERRDQRLRALLEDGPVPDDQHLVRLAQDLQRLENEVTL